MTIINWDKPYAKICGVSPVPGARYQQDGKFFGVKGNEVVEPEEVSIIVDENPPTSSLPTEIPPASDVVEMEEDLVLDKEFVYKPPSDLEKEIPPDLGLPTKEHLQELVGAGKTHTQIGQELGISRQKVTKILCK